MKTSTNMFLTSITLALGLLALTSTAATGFSGDVASVESFVGVRTDTISVPDMQCGMCEEKISAKLKGVKGIKSVAADAEAKRVIVTYDPRKVKRGAIERSIARVGYSAGSAKAAKKAQMALPGCCRPS